MVSSGYYPNYNGGVEVITRELAEGLVARGHEVCVIYSFNEDSEYTLNGVKVISISPRGFPKIKMFHFFNRLLQLYNPFNIRKFKKIFQEFKPDIVHLHMVRALSLSILKVALDLNIKTISTLHEYFSLWNFNPFSGMEYIKVSKAPFYLFPLRQIQRQLTAKVNYVTAPIEDIIQKYYDEGYYRDVPTMVISNALRNEVNNACVKKFTLKFKFLILSRLMPFKGIELSLESFHNLKNDNVELHVAGSGYLDKLVLEYQAKDKRIFYHGFVMGEEKEELLKNCNCLLFVVDDLETFGLTALEALQHGMPVIASNVLATSKLISNNVDGYVVYNKTQSELIKAMEKMISSKNYENMSKQCIKKSREFDYKNMIDNYLSLYHEVLGDDSCE